MAAEHDIQIINNLDPIFSMAHGGVPLANLLARSSGEFGYMEGTTKKSDGSIYSVTVVCYHESFRKRSLGGNLIPPRGLSAIASVRSDPDTGVWRFDGLIVGETYTIKAYDHTGEFDPAIAAGRSPTPYT